MKRKLCFLLSAGVVAVVAVSIVGFQGTGNDDGRNKATRKIPLEAIYSTTGQTGLKTLDKKGVEDVFRRASMSGATNIFLVRGANIDEALKATGNVFWRGVPANVSKGPSLKASPEEHWLVAYFGIAPTTPPPSLVESVEQSEKLIRVTFAQTPENKLDKEGQRLCFWVPLGRLEAGTYTLELYDAQSKEVLFLRRVEVDKDTSRAKGGGEP